MDHRQFIRATTATEPVIAIAEEWLIRDCISLNDMTEDEVDAFIDHSGKLMDRLLQTPATTVDGMRAKLAVLYRWYGFDDATGATPTDYGGQMVRSLLADATSLTSAG